MRKQIKKVSVLGSGIMGPGIAQVMALSGRPVCMYDISEQALEKARTTLFVGLKAFAQRGVITSDQVKTCYDQVTYTTDFAEALNGTDLVLEAVSENPDVKKNVYQQVDKLAEADLIIASNTSFLNVFELMPQRRLPYTVIAHWYAPAQMVPLVEVCPGEQTRPWVADLVMELLREGGKTPVLMKKFIQGYIVNRLQMCLNQEVFYLLDNEYCTPQDIDLAVKSSMIPRAMVLGLCQRMDFASLNMYANNLKNKVYTPHPVESFPRTLQEHIERGEIGIHEGKGFYDYTGKDVNELMAKRDQQLFDAFQLERKFMDALSD